MENEKYKCLNCGAELEDGQEFCDKCGTQRGHHSRIKCSECGAEITENQKFCPKCGAKVGLSSEVINKKINNATSAVKKIKAPFVIAIVVVLLLVVGGVSFVTISNKNKQKLLEDYNNYLNNGDFKSAYELCDSGKVSCDKEKFYYTNFYAYISSEIASGLKNPDSFKLVDVRHDPKNNEFVFSINGTNSYGGTVKNYYDYRWEKDNEEYGLFVYLSSLEDEKTYSWDTTSEALEKILKNVVRKTVSSLLNDSSKKVDIDDYKLVETIKENGKLSKVELLNETKEFLKANVTKKDSDKDL